MKIEIEKCKVRTKGFAKVIVAGSVIGKSERFKAEIQEKLETIYHLFRWRLIIYHNMKFIRYY